MPHQHRDLSKAAAQNAAVSPEPRAYAAPDVADATLTDPAAGEMGEFADEGDATGFDGQQQGSNHVNRPHRTEAQRSQGRLTRQLQKKIINRQ